MGISDIGRAASRLISKQPEAKTKEAEAKELAEKLESSKQKLARFVNSDWQTVARELEVDVTQGLSSLEAKARLEKYGPNELEKDPPTPLWKLFLEQFEDLLVLLLIAAAIVAMALGQVHSVLRSPQTALLLTGPLSAVCSTPPLLLSLSSSWPTPLSVSSR